MKYLLVGIGGFLGAIGRYMVGSFVGQSTSAAFPLGTLLINVSGSFLLGFLYEVGTERFAVSPEFRTFAAVGFLGAYTTFSTFSLETVKLIQDGSGLAALANVAANVGFGLVAVAAGVILGKLV